MAFGKIELGEIVVVSLDVGSLGDRKTHVGKNGCQFVDDLADRMDASNLRWRLAHWQAHIQRLGVESLIERHLLQRLFAGGDRRADAVLKTVDKSALLLAPFR